MEGCTYFLLYGDSRPLSRSFCVGEVAWLMTRQIYLDGHPFSYRYRATAVHELFRQS